MRLMILCALLVSCAAGNVNHCPPNTATIALQCKADVAKGLKSKEQCYQEIEESCP